MDETIRPASIAAMCSGVRFVPMAFSVYGVTSALDEHSYPVLPKTPSQ